MLDVSFDQKYECFGGYLNLLILQNCDSSRLKLQINQNNTQMSTLNNINANNANNTELTKRIKEYEEKFQLERLNNEKLEMKIG